MNVNVTADELDLIEKITQRYASLAEACGTEIDRLHVTIDLALTHLNGCPLKLQALLDSADGDFLHDVTGIRRYVDRRTGQLQECFCPRYAAP